MYINSTGIAEMERIQLDEGCCGVYTYTDLRYTPWYDDNEGSSLLAPPSCCAVDDVIDNCTASLNNISPQVYTTLVQGCLTVCTYDIIRTYLYGDVIDTFMYIYDYYNSDLLQHSTS